jgi:hypothetical protein
MSGRVCDICEEDDNMCYCVFDPDDQDHDPDPENMDLGDNSGYESDSSDSESNLSDSGSGPDVSFIDKIINLFSSFGLGFR